MFSVTHLDGIWCLHFRAEKQREKILLLCIPQKCNGAKKKYEMQILNWIRYYKITQKLAQFLMSQISDTGNITSSCYITDFWYLNTSVNLCPPWKLSHEIFPSVTPFNLRFIVLSFLFLEYCRYLFNSACWGGRLSMLGADMSIKSVFLCSEYSWYSFPFLRLSSRPILI